MNSVKVGLVGNPNCGKTTVFNALTGSSQRVGNWPGVTVERKTGVFKWNQTTVKVVDLPGIYSLSAASETSSIDERIACDYTLSRKAQVIVNIIDASHLERHLYLTMQLIEMQVPVIVALNMMDVARAQGKRISLSQLEERLGCPVVALEARKGKGIKELKQLIAQFGAGLRASSTTIPYPPVVMQAIEELCESLASGGFSTVENVSPSSLRGVLSTTKQSSLCYFQQKTGLPRPAQDAGLAMTAAGWLAIRLLEEDVYAQSLVSEDILATATVLRQRIHTELNEDADILLADARYRFIQAVISQCVKQERISTQTWTARIDRVVLNRLLGIPIFLGAMYSMFLFAIQIGGVFQDFFDRTSNAIFVDGFAYGLTQLHSPPWLIALLAEGVGKGVNTVVTFIPVIGALFLFLAFLEDSGYMARAAFVVDRLMGVLGLPGKAFVPMIIGFGCNVPAVMAARTLENKRDRILTVMMSPFMSCSARFAVYSVFAAAFFPKSGQNIIFMLYLIGIGMAMLTGLLLRKTVLQGEAAPLILELPPYHAPRFKTLCIHAWRRLKDFVLRAGKLIVPVCIILGVLNVMSVNGTLITQDNQTDSLLAKVGQTLTPIFAPMGIHADNWPATVGLVSGVLAKEVVVGTLNSLYSQLGHVAVLAGDAPVHTVSQGVYGLMVERFDGVIGAMAYLLFTLLYFPCVSTTAAMWRELGRGWTLFSVCWTTGLAYATAVGFYQIATFGEHPMASTGWVTGILVIIMLTLMTLRLRQTSLPSQGEGGRQAGWGDKYEPTRH